MTKQKQLVTVFILLVSILANFGYASWSDNLIPVEELYDVVDCSHVSKIYLDENNDWDDLDDIFFYLNSNFTLTWTEQDHTAGQIIREMNRTTYTKVKYYTPLQNMFYKITNTNQTWPIDNYTFWRASRVFPYNTPVRGIATTPNKVVFEQPADNNPNKNIISIVYEYKYKYAQGFDGKTQSPYWYNQIPDMSYVGNNYVTWHNILPGEYGNRKRSWSSIHTLETCRNYELHRCGDGTIDEYDSSRAHEFEPELCDDGPNNGQPWYCDINCGRWGWIAERCWDKIIQEPWTYYASTDIMSFEVCDDGDDPEDTNEWFTNGNDPAFHRCDLICGPTYSEAFVEVFIEA